MEYIRKINIKYSIILILYALFLFGQQSVFAQVSQEWVWPTYKTGAFFEKNIQIEDKYLYQEQSFNQPAKIIAIDKSKVNYLSPEASFIARMSAMKQLDYNWWLETLDPESRKIALKKYMKDGLTAEYWKNIWKVQFSDSTVKLIRKIVVKDNVILTYKIISNEGKDLSAGFEIPSVYKKVDDRWFATLDLRSSPFLQFSPWVKRIQKKVTEVDYR